MPINLKKREAQDAIASARKKRQDIEDRMAQEEAERERVREQESRMRRQREEDEFVAKQQRDMEEARQA